MSTFGDKLRQLAKKKSAFTNKEIERIELVFEFHFDILKEGEAYQDIEIGKLLDFDEPEVEDDGIIWMNIETPKTGHDDSESQTPHHEVFSLCAHLSKKFDLTFEGWSSSGGGWGILQWRKKEET